MKPATLFPLLGLLAALTPPAAALNPGDIAIIGFNADGNDDLAFVALTNLPPSQEILFTDNQWPGQPISPTTEFSDSEGVIFWLGPATGVAAGSIVTLNGINSVTPNSRINGVNLGIVGASSGSFNISDSDEAIFAYQALPFPNPDRIPTVILAVLGNNTVSATGNDLTGSGLTEGTGNALFLTGDEDVMAYNGLRVTQTTFAGYLPLIADPASWITEDGDGDQSANGTAPDIPFDSTAFVLGGTAPALTISFPSGSSAAENAGSGAISGRVTRSGSTTGNLAVTIAISDATEAASLPTVTILNGNAFANFDIDAVDDQWPDGPQSVDVTVSATNFTDDTRTITITDDGSDAFSLIVNEAYYGVSGSMLDANGDGTADQDNGGNDDEFVEIVNTTGATFDLAGVRLFDNSGTAFHTFPNGSTLGAGCAIVVFGGGGIEPGSLPGAFGTAEVQPANGTGPNGGLSLDDTGDVVTIKDDLGNEIHAVTLPDQSAQPAAGSYTLATDGDASSGYLYHTTTAGAAAFSPGSKADGSDFCTLTGTVTVSFNVPHLLETAGTVANAATISLPAAPAQPVTVRLTSSDTGELIVTGTATISPPASSVLINLTAVDDTEVDGTQVVTLGARASGYLNGSNTIDIRDAGDAPAFTGLVINELDAQTPGIDAAEFIELFNKTDSPQSLDGLVLVLYNGTNDQSYAAYDLTGHSIPASGFFVLGNAAVPGASIVFQNNWLQDGADAVALYVGSIGDFPNGTLVTGTPGTLVDALVYDDNDGDDAGLIGALTPGQAQISEGANGKAETQSIARIPDGGTALNTTSYVAQKPSPGLTNILPPSNFANWLTDNGYSATGFDNDSDGDGDSNGAEWYFFGTSPDAPNANGSAITVATTASGGTFTFTHRRLFDRADVIEAYQWSTNLNGTWYPSGASDDTTTVTITPGAATPDGTDYEIVTVAVAVDPPTTDKIFIRLELAEAP